MVIYPVPGKLKSDMICKAFAHGAPRNANGCVFFGTEGRMTAFQQAQVSGEPWFYLDNSYFDKHRGTYFRATKNALQHSGKGESDGKRFAKLRIEIKPWRKQLGEDVLVCPQSDDFMKSTLGFKFDWAADTVRRLGAWHTQRVRVRPWNRDKIKAAMALLDDLPNVRLLVTHSSSAAITAMLEGVPAISEAGAAHLLTGGLSSESVATPPRPIDRLRFAQVLADNMFTLEEFRSGEAWAWLAGKN